LCHRKDSGQAGTTDKRQRKSGMADVSIKRSGRGVWILDPESVGMLKMRQRNRAICRTTTSSGWFLRSPEVRLRSSEPMALRSKAIPDSGKRRAFFKYGCVGGCLRLPPARGMHTTTSSSPLANWVILFPSRIESTATFCFSYFHFSSI
jgi:hypothetical protein